MLNKEETQPYFLEALWNIYQERSKQLSLTTSSDPIRAELNSIIYLAIVCIKNTMVRRWKGVQKHRYRSSSRVEVIDEKVKAAMRANFINEILNSANLTDRIFEQLVECIKVPIRSDYPDDWPEMHTLLQDLLGEFKKTIESGFLDGSMPPAPLSNTPMGSQLFRYLHLLNEIIQEQNSKKLKTFK